MTSASRLFRNLPVPVLVEMAIARKEGMLTDAGALVALTGKRTGRSPQDKYIVHEPSTADKIAWGKVNAPLDATAFAKLVARAEAYLAQHDQFQHDGYVGADPKYRIALRVHATYAWHALFARCLFLRPTREELTTFTPEWRVLGVPDLPLEVGDGLKGSAVIAVSFETKTVLIAGTHYAGEIKKSLFTILNAILPWQGVLPMHCSANIGARGDVALFFGLSGTGKTTLSADPERRLIGDDEHGWADTGVFNFEGGCYAKTIRLTRAGEPQIFDAIRFGSVLENVPVDPETRIPDYASEQYTENTRAAYPLDFIPNAEPSGMGGVPSNVIFLTCDAFGVLPPISKLSPEQAMDYFLAGYTAKVAGTEAGVTEPTATFSTCFGAPFLPLAPRTYAELLRERLTRYRVPVWLVNTGWTGGGYGVGKRMSLTHTRAVLHAALDGRLKQVPFAVDPVFGVEVPRECPGVPAEVLSPREAWADKAAYDTAAAKLVSMFREQFAKHRADA